MLNETYQDQASSFDTVELKYRPTEKIVHVADVLTKGLSQDKFVKLRHMAPGV